MTRSVHVLGCREILVSIAIFGAAFTGCGSSKPDGAADSGRGGTGGGTPGVGGGGSGGTLAGGGGTLSGNGGNGAGGLGSGGVAAGGAGSKGSGGVGAGGTGAGGTSRAGSGGIGGAGLGGSGGKATGGTGAGGTGGRIGAGGSGVGGVGAGGTGGSGVDAGVCPSGQMWCPGCTPGTGSCGPACPGLACPVLDAGTVDAPFSQDALVPCGQLTTQVSCDQRSDCHSVNVDQQTCGCSTPGCCMKFSSCETGGAVACDGPVSCNQPTPSCAAPYAVGYSGNCFYGCVLASKCSGTACPLTAPTNGASCGGMALSCVYQDCAGAGRTLADCKGGFWSAQTASCDSLKCQGGGIYTGYLFCDPGQLCVLTTGGGGAYVITPSCMDNTCAPSPITVKCLGLSSNCYVTGTQVSCSEPSLCGSGQGGCQ